MEAVREFLDRLDNLTHDSFYLPSFLGPDRLGRIVFQSHPSVLFRMPVWHDENTLQQAEKLLPVIYRSFVDGSIERTLPATRFPTYTRMRLLRALCGYALLKGHYSWLFSLAFSLFDSGARCDGLYFLCAVAALKEGRTVLSEFMRAQIQTETPFMRACVASLTSNTPYDELEHGGVKRDDWLLTPVLDIEDFFNPGIKRTRTLFVNLMGERERSEAALGWMLLSGRALSFYGSAKAYADSRKMQDVSARALSQANFTEKEVHSPEPDYRNFYLESHSGPSRLAKIQLSESAGQHGDHETSLQWLATLPGWHPRILHLRAVAHVNLGEYGLAAACYRRIVKRFPREALFCRNYGALLEMLGETEAAARAFERAKELS